MADLGRIRTILSYGAGGPGVVTHYFVGSSGFPTNADATDMCARVRAFWVALAPMLYTGCAAAVNGAVDVIDETDGSLVGGVTGTTPAIVPGTGGATPLPPAVAVVVRYQTSTIVGKRRLEGRSFITQLSTVASTNGAPTTSVGSQTVSAVAALLSGSTSSKAVVWSRPGGDPHRAGSDGQIIGGTAAPFFGSIRSRRD